MIYLDESGDDGNYVLTNSKFFVVCIVITDNSFDIEKEYNMIKKILNIKNKNIKWNNLNADERIKFINYINSNSFIYEVHASWVDKKGVSDFNNLYKNIASELLLEINNSDTVKYKGAHLIKMFEKIRRELKKKNLKFIFIENGINSNYGITLADLWAGYINYCNKNDIKIVPVIKIKEFVERSKIK